MPRSHSPPFPALLMVPPTGQISNRGLIEKGNSWMQTREVSFLGHGASGEENGSKGKIENTQYCMWATALLLGLRPTGTSNVWPKYIHGYCLIALFTVDWGERTWMFINKGLDKLRYIHLSEYYAAIKMNELCITYKHIYVCVLERSMQCDR